MARVNVEQKALTDPRFLAVGRFVQCLERSERSLVEHACGLLLCIRVWDQCQERGTDTLPEHLIDCIQTDLTSALVASDLAERVGKKMVRIKGAKERCLWLSACRSAGKEGGKRGGRPPHKPPGVYDGETPGGSARKTPPTPTPTLTPKEKKKETPLPPATGGGESGDPVIVDIDLWDEFVAAWVKARLPGWDKGIQRTSYRVGYLQTRLAADSWRHQWRTAIERAGKSVRCRQGSGDWNGLQLDTFLKDPDVLVRIIEGQFDDAQSNGMRHNKAAERKSRVSAALDRALTPKVQPE